MRINRCGSLYIAALAGCALLVTSALSPELIAKDMVPYKGAGWGTPLWVEELPPTDEHPYGGLGGLLAETGEATHFGQYNARLLLIGYYEYDLEEEVWVLVMTGQYVQTAADGSSITADLTGREVVVPDGPPFPLTLTIRITGGTGRFEGATGSWEITGAASGDYTYTAEGTISSVGSLRGHR